MAVTSQELLDYMYDRCLPEIYRTEDKVLGKPLYRYLQSLIVGGYEPVIKDIDNIISLVNPDTCPEKFFPLLYESFGLTYYPDVDLKYHRKFLSNFGELVRRRGTYSCIRYLVQVLTGFEVHLRYIRGEYKGVYGRHLILQLTADEIGDIVALNFDEGMSVVHNFLGLFLPYYITTHISADITNKDFYVPHEYMAMAMEFKSDYVVSPTITKLNTTLYQANPITNMTYYKLGSVKLDAEN